jgi:lipoyl(octanoyl) transferase
MPKPRSERRLPEGVVEWAVSLEPVDYLAAVRAMEARAELIAAGAAPELVWLLEHPPIYTAGTSARASDLIVPDRFPVVSTGRGGKFTYHGPGQRVVYVMLDVRRRFGDVRAFVSGLEAWIIDTLAALGVGGETRPGRVGIWVPRPGAESGTEDKIAAIGLRLKKWVSLHGLSLNVSPDLSHYEGIVPCGIAEHGVTSLARLGKPTAMKVVDKALKDAFEHRFGPTRSARAAPQAQKRGAPAPLAGPGPQTKKFFHLPLLVAGLERPIRIVGLGHRGSGGPVVVEVAILNRQCFGAFQLVLVFFVVVEADHTALVTDLLERRGWSQLMVLCRLTLDDSDLMVPAIAVGD